MQGFKKEIIQFLSFLVPVAVFLIAKFGVGIFATSAKIHTNNMMHSGWESARAELRKSVEKEVGAVALPPDIKKNYVDCVTNKAVDFLNHTVCSYLYNKLTTTREEHLKAQDECIAKSGYNQEMEKIADVCANDTIKMAASH